MTELLFVRHGQTDWNRERRIQGHTDAPLNEAGRRQARELAAELEGAGAVAVYTSDLSRAHETAEIIGARLSVPVVADSDLREKNWGTWEGLIDGEHEGDHGGETTEEHAERVLRAVGRIAEEHPAETVIVVTHGGSVRRIQAAAAGTPLSVIDNCSVWTCVHKNGVLRGID